MQVTIYGSQTMHPLCWFLYNTYIILILYRHSSVVFHSFACASDLNNRI